jgi:hypothetical protein
LKVFVLEGEAAVNFIPDGKGKTLVVEVRDSNDLPIEGVDVRFELPPSGPGGFFADGKYNLTVKTNLQGQAEAPFAINTQPGPFKINVTATTGENVGHATVSQSNSLKIEEVKAAKPHHWYTNWKILAAAAAAGAIIGIILGTRGGSSKPTVTITPGAPTFGGPGA